MHRDIKPDNFLFSGDPELPETTVKLIDFGLSTFFHPREPEFEAVGSPSYVSWPWGGIRAAAATAVREGRRNEGSPGRKWRPRMTVCAAACALIFCLRRASILLRPPPLA